jgi:hypothetical protein
LKKIYKFVKNQLIIKPKTMKRILFALLILGNSYLLAAQTIVSTTPENKKVILEEFTGTGCPNCPGGHTAAATLLNDNLGNLFVIAYHPNNSSYTASDPMVTTYSAAFYTMPFISSVGRYMPSAMINRRVWGGVERIQGVGNWTNDVNSIKAEASPLNVGISSTYNTSTHMLNISVEVYFTSTVSDALTIYVELTEDGIIAAQSGGTSPYTHNHVFRQSLVSQWGDVIPAPSSQSTLKTFSFSYDNSTTLYDMTKCEVVAFVRNAVDEEIISGNGAIVGQSSASINENKLSLTKTSVYPNPINNYSVLSVSLLTEQNISYSIFNTTGQDLLLKDLGVFPEGDHQIAFENIGILSKGVYFLRVNVGKEISILKVIIE